MLTNLYYSISSECLTETLDFEYALSKYEIRLTEDDKQGLMKSAAELFKKTFKTLQEFFTNTLVKLLDKILDLNKHYDGVKDKINQDKELAFNEELHKNSMKIITLIKDEFSSLSNGENSDKTTELEELIGNVLTGEEKTLLKASVLKSKINSLNNMKSAYDSAKVAYRNLVNKSRRDLAEGSADAVKDTKNRIKKFSKTLSNLNKIINIATIEIIRNIRDAKGKG